MTAAVTDGRMPPWLPGPDSVPLRGDRRLPASLARTLEQWAQNPILGTPTKAPTPETPAPPDVVLRSEPYRSTSPSSDELRCFVLRGVPAGDVRGYGWVVEDVTTTHHMAADIIAGADVAAMQQYDDQDPAPGWDCTRQTPNVRSKASLIDTAPRGRLEYPAGYGVRIDAGDAVMLQVHVLPRRQLAPTTYGVGLLYAAEPVRPVSVWTVVAPSELPCPPSQRGRPECDPAEARKSAILGDSMPSREQILATCGPELLGTEDGGSYPIASRCSGPLPGPSILAVGLRIHAHGHTVAARLTSTRPDGSPVTLLDIPRWDWHWEGEFVPVEELRIAQNARLECWFDNGTAHQPLPDIGPAQLPQHRVYGDLRREAEMCLATIAWAY
jgi:hypothetical protein